MRKGKIARLKEICKRENDLGQKKKEKGRSTPGWLRSLELKRKRSGGREMIGVMKKLRYGKHRGEKDLDYKPIGRVTREARGGETYFVNH